MSLFNLLPKVITSKLWRDVEGADAGKMWDQKNQETKKDQKDTNIARYIVKINFLF